MQIKQEQKMCVSQMLVPFSTTKNHLKCSHNTITRKLLRFFDFFLLSTVKNVCSFFSVRLFVLRMCWGRLLYDYLLERNSNVFVYFVIHTTFSWFICIIHSVFLSPFLALLHSFDLSSVRLGFEACFILLTLMGSKESHRSTSISYASAFSSAW